MLDGAPDADPDGAALVAADEGGEAGGAAVAAADGLTVGVAEPHPATNTRRTARPATLVKRRPRPMRPRRPMYPEDSEGMGGIVACTT